jgi:hypothetical protein
LGIKRVSKLEISSDKKEQSSILLTVLNDNSQQMIEITLSRVLSDFYRAFINGLRFFV